MKNTFYLYLININGGGGGDPNKNIGGDEEYGFE